MATNYKLKREFKVGERVYIPTYGEELPLPNSTATQFTIVGTLTEGNTDKTTVLIVTYQHGKETLKLSVTADKVYKIAPSLKCAHCGHEICFEPDKKLCKEYNYYCPDCNENLYGVEVEY